MYGMPTVDTLKPQFLPQEFIRWMVDANVFVVSMTCVSFVGKSTIFLLFANVIVVKLLHERIACVWEHVV